MKTTILALLLAASCAVPLAAQTVVARSQTGKVNGLKFTAESRIIGQTSTATVVGGGDPLYLAPRPQYSGVVALVMNYAAGSFICSGSLLSDRRSVVTAGHCVSDGGLGRPLSTQAYFYGGPDDLVVATNPAATAIQVANYFVNPDYTGDVVDQNDIAILRLADLAPAFATSYDLYASTDLEGSRFTVAGYGQRSDVGGSFGANLGTGRLRQGDNVIEFRLGDPGLEGYFTDIIDGTNAFGGTAAIDFSYVSDFDNGLAANDTACLFAGVCDTGLGALEVSIAGGDSGSPQFIDGRIAGVSSYGFTFGAAGGDIRAGLNSSFGEFNGFVPIFLHTAFIDSVVPEPASWAMMIMGFGLVGAAARRSQVGAPARA